MASLDCTRCGACCCNPDENRKEDFPYYIEIAPGNRLLSDPGLRKRYVVLDPDGVPHMRLDPSGRCAALKGPLGVSAKCQIYADRHRGCRLVQPGDPACLRARRERGVGAEPS